MTLSKYFKTSRLKRIAAASIISTTLPTLAPIALAEDGVDPLYADTTPGLYKVAPKFNTAFERYDPHTGTYTKRHTDLVIPDSSGLDIRIVREGASSSGDILGKTWKLNLGSIGVWQYFSDKTAPYFKASDGSIQQFYPNSQFAGYISKDLWRLKTNRKLVSWRDEDNEGRRNYRIVSLDVTKPNGVSYHFVNNLKYDHCKEANSIKLAVQFECLDLKEVKSSTGAYYTIYYGNTQYTRDEDRIKVHYVAGVSHSNGSVLGFHYSGNIHHLGNRSWMLKSITLSGKTMVNYGYRNHILHAVSYSDGSSWEYGSHTPLGVKSKLEYQTDKIRRNNSKARRLVRKSLFIPGYGVVTNHYSYADNDSKKEVYTFIKGANDCQVNVYYSGKYSDARYRGLLKREETYDHRDCKSNKLKVTAYDYEQLKISAVTHTIASFNGIPLKVMKGAFKPLTKSVITTLYKANGDQDQFRTIYDDFDAYGNPKTIRESFFNYDARSQSWDDYDHRITHRTYKNIVNDSVWRLGLLATESVDGITGNVSYEYDSKGQLVSKNSYGQVTKYGYNGNGYVTSITDAKDQTFNYSNFKRGIAQTVTGPESYAINRAVDNYGNITSQTKWTMTSGFSYDNANRVTQVRTPSSSDADTNISYAYNNDGYRKTVTRGANKTETQYNGFGQPSWIKTTVSGQNSETPASTTVYFKYDDQGRQTFASYANNPNAGTTTSYDALGRVTKITVSDGSTITYEYLGLNRVKVTDQTGNVTINSYLSYGDPSEQYLTKIQQLGTTGNTDAIVSDAITTTINRNALGLVESVRQGSFTNTYTYDSAWRVASITKPEIGKTTFEYDANGNLISKQVGSNPKTQYHYDGLNRLKTTDYPDGTADINYRYNAKGLLAAITKAPYSWAYGYNTNGALTSEKLTDNALNKSWTIHYTLDKYDNLQSLTYPGNKTIAYQPDSGGRPTKAGSYASDINYYANGSVKSLTYGNGRTLSIGKDSRERPNQITVDNSTLDLSYAFYNDSDVKAITDNLNSSNSLAMQYDQHHRLREVTGPLWGSGQIHYDVNGNITKKTIDDVRMVYYYDKKTNRLTDIGGDDDTYVFSYDGYGNVTSNGSYTFSYDHDGTMLDAQSNSSAQNFSYEYDAYNRRVKQRTNGELKKISLYNKAGQLLMDEDKDGYRTYYIFAGGERIAEVKQCADTDTDGDGLADCEEKHLRMDPKDKADGLADNDNDGLSNAYEYNNGLNRNNADTDGDGINDGWEVANGLDPKTNDATADNDNDGLTNAEEYTVNTAANKADTDGDGISDSEDDKPNFNLAAFIPVMQLILN